MLSFDHLNTELDSGIHVSCEFWIPYMYWIDSGFLVGEHGLWTPIVSDIPDSLS